MTDADGENAAVPCRQTPLVHLHEIESTNAEAMRLALGGATGPLWVLADRQTAGRGRSGRSWASLEGNLAASLLLPLDCPAHLAPRLALVAGVALVEALDALNGGVAIRGLSLKWPNDALIDGAKLAGILIETTRIGARDLAVVGIGLNLASAPAVEGRRVAALIDATGHPVSPMVALHALDAAFAGLHRKWSDEDRFATVRAAWMQRAMPIGTVMTVDTVQTRVRGRFAGLDPSGALLLACEDGAQRTFTFGDVTLASEREMS